MKMSFDLASNFTDFTYLGLNAISSKNKIDF